MTATISSQNSGRAFLDASPTGFLDANRFANAASFGSIPSFPSASVALGTTQFGNGPPYMTGEPNPYSQRSLGSDYAPFSNTMPPPTVPYQAVPHPSMPHVVYSHHQSVPQQLMHQSVPPGYQPTMPQGRHQTVPQQSVNLKPESFRNRDYVDRMFGDSSENNFAVVAEVPQDEFRSAVWHHHSYLEDREPSAGQEKKAPKEKPKDYHEKLHKHKKAEKHPRDKVELHHVQKLHEHVESAKAGRLEKDLLHLRDDQLERRLAMLERIAGAAPPHDRVEEMEKAYDKQDMDPNARIGPISPFMDKFLPIPLGGGRNWHYYNHFEGFYIDRTKIAQREAQLKFLQSQHAHPLIYCMAGRDIEEVPEEYWDRDYRSWAANTTENPLVSMSLNNPDRPMMMPPGSMAPRYLGAYPM